MAPKKRRRYDLEFKADAVKLILHEKLSIAEASRRLGVEYSVLRRWKVKLEKILPPPSPATPPPATNRNIADLETELAKIVEERNILLKALSHFVVEDK